MTDAYIFDAVHSPEVIAFPSVVAWRDRIRGLPGWKHPYELMPGHPL